MVHDVWKGIPEFFFGNDFYMVPKACCFRNLGSFFHLIVAIAFVKAYGKGLVCSGSCCQIARIHTAGQKCANLHIA